MARTPVRIQGGAFGTGNPSSFEPSYANRSQPQPTVLQRGPSQGMEQFSAGNLADASSVARALNQMQSNVQSAVGPSKNSPFADGNLIEQVTFTFGAATIVKHGLGAPARGYMMMNANSVGVTTHKVAQSPASLEEQTISIYAGSPGDSGSFTGDVWVYR